MDFVSVFVVEAQLDGDIAEAAGSIGPIVKNLRKP
jgi:hypothetical protein